MPSARFINAVLAPDSSYCAVVLATLTHASFPAPIRVCEGGADLTSGGNLFKARGMIVTLPGDSADASGRAGKLEIEDVERDLIGLIRNASTRPAALLQCALTAYPDDVELAWAGLTVTNYRALGDAIELEIGPRDDSVETFPLQAFTPHRCPGLFD